jgi:hypothetical protein
MPLDSDNPAGLGVFDRFDETVGGTRRDTKTCTQVTYGLVVKRADILNSCSSDGRKESRVAFNCHVMFRGPVIDFRRQQLGNVLHKCATL